jgi:hypothetical protein
MPKSKLKGSSCLIVIGTEGRVVTRDEDLNWSPEERVRHAAEFSAGLPPHRGLTVVVRRFGGTAATGGGRAQRDSHCLDAGRAP